jgi:hypothetical protein
MLKSQQRLFGYILPFAVAAICLFSSQTFAQRGANDREHFISAPLSLTLTADTSVVSACANGGAQVKLNARATSPSGNPIRFHWTTAVGRIIGDGPNVTWDLTDVDPGYYKASVEIDTANGQGDCVGFSSMGVFINACAPPTPVCPNVSVSCPTDVVTDQPLTFTSNVTAATTSGELIYNWTVSAATIIEGQGTPTIKVDTKGLAGQTIRATLSMGGIPLNCFDSCAVQIPIPQAACNKFDEFPTISRNDEKARLDNFGIALQNDPTSTAYVIVFPGRSSKPADVKRQATRIVDYLVNSRAIDEKRITTVVGSSRDKLSVQLWACPPDAKPSKQ